MRRRGCACAVGSCAASVRFPGQKRITSAASARHRRPRSTSAKCKSSTKNVLAQAHLQKSYCKNIYNVGADSIETYICYIQILKYYIKLKWDLVGSLRLEYQRVLRLKLQGSERTDPKMQGKTVNFEESFY